MFKITTRYGMAFIAIIALLLALAACGIESTPQPESSNEQPITEEQEGQTTDKDSSVNSGPSPSATMVAIPQTAERLAEPVVDAEFDMAESADDGAAVGAPPPAPLGAAAGSGGDVAQQEPIQPTPGTGETQPPVDMFFEEYGVNPMLDTEDDHLSTFAMDVDTGSYTLARSYLVDSGMMPPPEAIRSEEFINYFDVGYEPPQGDDAFAIHLEAAPAPFGYENHYLLRVGLQGRYIPAEERDPAFLIFVVDVSGSMDQGNRLGLAKQALAILVDELREDDRVAIVVYANETRVVLEPTPASEKEAILAGIDALQPSGSTYAEAGLRLGYQLAEENMRDGEITRLILISDGVANVGETGPDAILGLVQDSVDKGITLSTIGFGMGNYNDVLMEQLANDGNGNYYYVDNLREARRIFVHNLVSTLQIIAYDAKVQVDFNSDVTDRYRLIGYENRAIADEDFRDDTVDAGEVGAGHSVTALYELALEDADSEGVVATVYIRYENADTREVVEVSKDITTADLLPSIDDASAGFRLQAGVAEFSEMLRESYWAQDATYGAVLALVEPLEDDFADSETVGEFIELVRLAIRYGDQ